VIVDPKEIRFKISPHHDLKGRQDGDWDLDRRFPVEGSAKYRSIVERYAHGKPWQETELFTDLYRRRFDNGENIRGENTMKGLLSQYYGRVDSMFADMKKNGFRSNCPLPKLLIGRDGEVFIGNQGNHRLAMAVVLNINIKGEILCRHQLA
jgi:hypothetical protein